MFSCKVSSKSKFYVLTFIFVFLLKLKYSRSDSYFWHRILFPIKIAKSPLVEMVTIGKQRTMYIMYSARGHSSTNISTLQQFRMTAGCARAQRDTCPVFRCPPSPSSGRKKPHQYSSLLSPRPPPTWPGRRRYDEG